MYVIDAPSNSPPPISRMLRALGTEVQMKRLVVGLRWCWMSSDQPPADTDPAEGRPAEDETADWRSRVREWASQLGDWVDALLPTPHPTPVLVPVPVRNRRRR